MGLQFGFEALEQGEGVGGAAGETSQYLAVVEAMNLRALPFMTVLPRKPGHRHR